MKKQAAGSEKAFFSKSGTSCNIQAKSLSLNKPNRPDLRRNAIRLPAEIADTSSIVNFIRLRD